MKAQQRGICGFEKVCNLADVPSCMYVDHNEIGVESEYFERNG